ncbi:GNAT family N-acetyltransferase [Labedaea rhizosphaerae]|uniref:GNAT family N-acetyltransferase n=1 Tax=Labedaea rhizosphaerae TaxID=598644 RepID=UPI001AACF644|nr:GNAT family N-acetyltransferase [Labedaea rhizosphaerae]
MHASFVEAMAEFLAECGGDPERTTMVGNELVDDRWRTPEGFADYVASVRADAVRPRQAGWMTQTTWWWCAGSTYLGRIDLRHGLTEALRTEGGHIGYDVRPSARCRGDATAMVAAVLPHARAMGIDAVLLTCNAGNLASRRVIEANGGELEAERGNRCRYWITLKSRCG